MTGFFFKKIGSALLLGFLSNCRDLVSSKEDFLNLKINFTKIFVKQISRKKKHFLVNKEITERKYSNTIEGDFFQNRRSFITSSRYSSIIHFQN